MGLTLKSVSQFISDLQTGIISALSGNPPDQQITNFSTGSVALAITESTGAQMAFLQSQAYAVELLTRASTSYGADLDSLIADYNMQPPRQSPTFDAGSATFVRNQASASSQVLLVGTIIQNPTPSPASAVQYQVVADTTNAAYSATAGGVGYPGYTLTAGLTQFAQAPLIKALVAGTASNVIAGSLSVIASPSVPFDTVSNGSDINNAQDKETDLELFVRFQKYISSLAKANFAAIEAAILGTQVGLTYTINDKLDASDSPRVAYFTVVADDGSGAIPTPTLQLISASVDIVRAAGIGFTVIAPTNQTITVLVSGSSVQPSFNATLVKAAIQAAIIAYINSNGVYGANVNNAYVGTGKLSYVGIANVVGSFIGVNANQGLSSYSGITVNSGTVDIALTSYQLARATTGTVTVS